MLNFDEAFGSNESLEKEGNWFDLGDNARVKIARFGNPHHKKLMDRLRQPYRGYILRNQEIPEAENEKIILEAMAATIVLDWEGFYDADGREMLYSKEMALEALRNYRNFRDFVSTIALDASNFRSEAIEEVVKK